MIRALLACLTLIVLPVVTIGPDETTAALIAKIEGAQSGAGEDAALTVAEVMAKYHVPGVSVAVIKDFRVHWVKAYGVADVVTGGRVDANTLFQAASISKPVAAMAVLRAVQDSRFSLDDDINSIVKSWKLPTGDFTRDRPVTPRTLLSHTCASAYARADSRRPAAIERRSGPDGTPAADRDEVFGRRRDPHAARDDRRVGQALSPTDAGARSRSTRDVQQPLRSAAVGRIRRERGARTRS